MQHHAENAAAEIRAYDVGFRFLGLNYADLEMVLHVARCKSKMWLPCRAFRLTAALSNY